MAHYTFDSLENLIYFLFENFHDDLNEENFQNVFGYLSKSVHISNYCNYVAPHFKELAKEYNIKYIPLDFAKCLDISMMLNTMELSQPYSLELDSNSVIRYRIIIPNNNFIFNVSDLGVQESLVLSPLNNIQYTNTVKIIGDKSALELNEMGAKKLIIDTPQTFLSITNTYNGHIQLNADIELTENVKKGRMLPSASVPPKTKRHTFTYKKDVTNINANTLRLLDKFYNIKEI